MKKYLSIFICFIITINFLSCNSKPVPKTFTASGMSITLTNAFKQIAIENSNVDVAFESSDIAVYALKENFSIFSGFEAYTLYEYGSLVLEANSSRYDGDLKNVEGFLCFEYESHNDADNTDYKYFTIMMKGPTAFWTIQFVSYSEDYDMYYPSFIEWAKSIQFTNE